MYIMSDIEKLSVFDKRIVQQRPKFAVDKGALSLTNAPFNAIAATSSQMTFNIQVPSLNVFMDRELEWTTGTTMRMSVNVDGVGGAPAPASTPVVVFGKDVALSSFPLHAACSTITATINDAVSTINTSDVLYEVLRLVDRKHNKLQKSTPSMLDKYQRYDDAVGAINNPLASYFDATGYDNVPNGAFWNIVFTDSVGTELIGNGTYNDGTNVISFENGIPILSNDPGTGNAIEDYGIFFRFTVTEQLVLSPFIFNSACGDDVGLFGVNNVQLVFNFGEVSRLVKNAPAASTNSRTISQVRFASNAPFVNPRVNVQFLTPSLDIALPPKSVVPYMEYPRYISTPNQQIQPQSSATLQSQTITLPQIPDMLLIYAKPQQYANANQLGEFYCPIDQISVNFDNYAGLLSSHTAQQLYNMSVDNGLYLDWNAWNGKARVVNNDASAPVSAGNANNVPLVGGFLVLKMGKDITLQAGQAPSVVGNYTLQFNCRVNNTTDSPLTPALFVVAVNSGFFETQSGSSRIVKGVLTEQEVISAPLAPMGTRGDLERMVGGGFMSKLGSALNAAKGLILKPEGRELLKQGARMSGIGALGKAADVADAVGLGKTGGRMTGGRKGAQLKNLM